MLGFRSYHRADPRGGGGSAGAEERAGHRGVEWDRPAIASAAPRPERTWPSPIGEIRRAPRRPRPEIRAQGRRAEALRVDIAGGGSRPRWPSSAAVRSGGRLDQQRRRRHPHRRGGRLSRLREARSGAGGRSPGNGRGLVGGGRHDAASRAAEIVNMSWDHVIQGMAGENPGSTPRPRAASRASAARSRARWRRDIRVNILAPGFIETAFGEQADPRLAPGGRSR